METASDEDELNLMSSDDEDTKKDKETGEMNKKSEENMDADDNEDEAKV